MKSDQYLNLCFEQAALSPLHYRHGCVVVKGGKVIGQGFNDYRPGYDGGSVLKTGVLPKSACYDDDDPDKPDPPSSKSDFKTVESITGNCGGGHHVNARLTMHSEMMAINSALSSRSTLAASTVSHVKPCFKLPGDSKHKRALRRDAVVAYTKAVCLATFGSQVQQGAGKAQADEWRFDPSAYECAHQQQQNKCHVAEVRKTNKHDKHKAKANKKPQSSSSSKLAAHIDDDESDSESVRDAQSITRRDSGRSNTGKLGLRKARNKQLLVPKGRTANSSNRVQDRMKHPKLVGADVYVARLINDIPPLASRKQRRAGKKPSDGSAEGVGNGTVSGLSASTGSLYDELTCKNTKPQPPLSVSENVKDRPAPAESRPCYRCVAYMHSVGIKRVFWTTNEGKWECAKIRDLVDQLEGTMQSGADTSLGLSVLDVFVTKHEVLLLRRLMNGHG